MLGDNGLIKFSPSLFANKVLKKLSLYNNLITKIGIEKISDALSENNSLIDLNICIFE